METQTSKIETAVGQEFPKKVIPLIENAKKNIKIIIYDWRWYPDQVGATIQLFNNAIIRAKNKGIDVKVVVWNRGIYNILKNLNIGVKLIDTSKLLHVKLMIIDDEIVIIGSHNYTKNAFEINFEASLIVQDEQVAVEMQNLFSAFFY